MFEIIITVGILSFVIGGCFTLILILFLMGASPNTTQKRADILREWLGRGNHERTNN